MFSFWSSTNCTKVVFVVLLTSCGCPVETSAGWDELLTLSKLTHADTHILGLYGLSSFSVCWEPGLVTLQLLQSKKLLPHCHLTQWAHAANHGRVYDCFIDPFNQMQSYKSRFSLTITQIVHFPASLWVCNLHKVQHLTRVKLFQGNC